MGAIMVLAAVGAWHIVRTLNSGSFEHHQAAAKAIQPEPMVKRDKVALPEAATPTKRNDDTIAALSPEPQLQSPSPTVTSAPAPLPDLDREIAITDVRQTKKRGRRGETLVVATIGMAARSNLEKSDLEIHISFFDRTARNELRPTDAQVTYRWLTPVRDWSEPTTKYLAATYLQWPTRYRPFERFRYGGFLIQIYANGELQDERAEPQELLAMVRGKESTRLGSEAAPDVSSGQAALTNREKNVTAAKSPSSPTPSPLPEKSTSRDQLPYGKPVPGKPGFVSSPFDPKFIIDVRGFPPGTLVNDPNTNKAFRVP